jgi:anti-anti-sigma factor
MFSITQLADGVVALEGRFDASQIEAAKTVLDTISTSCTLDFQHLSYIASAGLGLLFATQKRLVDAGHGLTLANLNPHIREIFHIAGFDNIFEIK